MGNIDEIVDADVKVKTNNTTENFFHESPKENIFAEFDTKNKIFADADLKPKQPKATEQQSGNETQTKAKPLKYIIINIFAKPGEKFVGYELLQTLLAAGLRFGEMSIFHRYIDVDGKTIKLFSLARATEPGIFDINNMGAVNCNGLSLFLQVSENPKLNVKAFDTMLATAELLAEELNGIILDEKRQPLTMSRIDAYRHSLNMS